MDFEKFLMEFKELIEKYSTPTPTEEKPAEKETETESTDDETNDSTESETEEAEPLVYFKDGEYHGV